MGFSPREVCGAGLAFVRVVASFLILVLCSAPWDEKCGRVAFLCGEM